MYRCNRFNKCRAPRNFALIFSFFFFMLFGAVCLFCLSFSLHSSFFFRKLNIDNKKKQYQAEAPNNAFRRGWLRRRVGASRANSDKNSLQAPNSPFLISFSPYPPT